VRGLLVKWEVSCSLLIPIIPKHQIVSKQTKLSEDSTISVVQHFYKTFWVL